MADDGGDVGVPENPIKLGSVHLAEEDLYQLEDYLHVIAREPEIEFRVKSNGFTVSEPSIEDLASNEMVEDECLAYDIRFSAEEGTLRVVSDSTETDEHHLYIDGFHEWEMLAFGVVAGFLLSKRIRYRSFLDGDWVFAGNVVSGFLFTSSLTLIMPSIVQPVVHWYHYVVLLASLVGFYCTNRKNQVYPYFVASFDGDTKYPHLLSREILFWLVGGSVFGALLVYLRYSL